MRRIRKTRRGGVVLVCVLVCLAVASAIVLGAVRTGLRARRQMRSEIQLEQTRWLLEAGAVRAAQQLREQPDYSGETWRVGEALAKYERAIVEIAVDRDGVPARTARVTLRARIGRPSANERATSRSREVVVPLDETEPLEL